MRKIKPITTYFAAIVTVIIFQVLVHIERSTVIPKGMSSSNILYHKDNLPIVQINETILAIVGKNPINKSVSAIFGYTLLNNNVSLSDNICRKSTPGAIRCWDRSHPFVFIHVVKNGGQSFDHVISRIVRTYRAKYIGYDHFDWSMVAKTNQDYIAILLRHPVERLISLFYFTKTLDRTRGSPLRTISLHDYLKDYQFMLNTRGMWTDGTAAADWLIGTHFVNKDPDHVREREIVNLNHTHICLLAARRLEETWWFGFLEDTHRSFELLRYQMGYQKKISFAHHHKTGNKKVVSEEDRQVLESLLPLDMWFHKYAQLMFEARWMQYKTGVYVKPEMPVIPEPSCQATRFAIRCRKGPLSPLYFQGEAPPGHIYLI